MEPRDLPLPPVEALLATAEDRLRRRTAYARPLAGRPARARVLEMALATARATLAGALRPGALWRAVPASVAVARPDGDGSGRDGSGRDGPGGDGPAGNGPGGSGPGGSGPGGVVLLDGIPLAAPRLAAEVAAGGQPLVWLCTLGHDAQAVQDRLGDDRLLHHVAGELSVQALFAAARAVHAGLAACHPGRRLVRLALRPAGADRWDVAAVASLLPLFGPSPLGVVGDRDGAMRPAHTLLGAAVATPPP